MAVNLASKYSDKIATAFTHESFIRGKVSSAYDLTGVKTLKVYTPITVDEVDYTRTGSNRYGTPTEMQDTVQELTMTQDKSVPLTIDKGNLKDQMGVKAAGRMLRLQISEKSTPAADKYAFAQFAKMAGKFVAASAKPSKSTIVGFCADVAQAMDDALVPPDNRYIALTTEMVKFLWTSDEFIKLETLGTKAVSKGECGEIFGMRIVRVPSSYLPTDCYAIAWYKESVLMPYKIEDAKIHEDAPGYSGALLEIRHYYDAFVLGAKSNGVVALVLSSKRQATPTLTIASNKVTPTSASASEIKYTIDGTDPRYSDTAKVASGEITLGSGVTIKAVAYGATGYFTSDVASATNS